MVTAVQDLVAEVLAAWVLRTTEGSRSVRVNLRFVLSETGASEGVRRILEGAQDPGRVYRVRTSADEEAVRYRNQRPPEIDPDATFVFVLFWTPGLPGHEHNGQSLQDLRAVDVRDVLGHDPTFELAAEARVIEQVDAAASGWSEAHTARAREHLRRAWRALTWCLRSRCGGRERSVPFVRGVDAYARFITEALVPAEEWAALDPAARPAAMTRRWGSALVQLQLFQTPELAPVLGVATTTGVAVPSPSKTREDHWEGMLEQLLAENLEYALDPTGLGEAIAGKSALEDQLERLKTVPLCREEAAQTAARGALLRFCHDNDETALRAVEWIFYKDATNRRSPTQGLRGLLMARNQRAPRMSPLDRAREDTLELFKRTLSADGPDINDVQRFVDERCAAGSDGFAALREALEPSGPQESSLVPADVRRAIERAAAGGGWRARDASRIAARWEKLRQRESIDRTVEAPNVLQGVLRLVGQWTADRDEALERPRTILLRYESRAPQSMPVQVSLDPSDPGGLLDTLREFLIKKVEPVVKDERLAGESEEDDADDEAADRLRELTFFVEGEKTGGHEPIGRVEVRIRERAARLWKGSCGKVLVRWQRTLALGDEHVGAHRLLEQVADVLDEAQEASSPEISPVNAAWSAYIASCDERDEVIATIAPIHPAGRRWVDAWAAALASVESSLNSHGARHELNELQQTLYEAIARGDFQSVREIDDRRRQVEARASSAPPPPSTENVRKLLAQNTIVFVSTEGVHQRALLSPHHPLVVRLRILEDELVAEILRCLWAQAWPEAGRRELDDALGQDAWGLPEPMHAWCAWDGAPLVFENWLDGSWAAFARLDSGRQADAASIGVRSVSKIIEQYRCLFPAAADRLRLRVRADREGSWAWRVLDEQLDGDGGFSADVDLLTDLPERRPTAIDTAVLHRQEHIDAFELGMNGASPRVRVRRVVQNAQAAPAHMALVVGEQLDALHAEWKDERPRDPEPLDVWNRAALFAETLPEVRGSEECVRDPDDSLCRLVAIAMGFARNHVGHVVVERHSFDPTRCEAPLKHAQAGAHWLVLASRRPLYRALQQVGDRVTTLLDFRTELERGRAVHVAVGLNAERDRDDLRGLTARLSALLGDVDPAAARAMIRFAQRVAPGLALRAVGSTGGAELVGLLGLLLSANLLEDQSENGIVLSLDQHASLLESRMRGDLLVVRLTERGVGLGVVESKCSAERLDANSAAAVRAAKQVAATLDGLQRFKAQHALTARSRLRLARALVQQGHMRGVEGTNAGDLDELVRRVRDTATEIEIGPSVAHRLLLWSLSAETKDEEASRPEGMVIVRGRTKSLDGFHALVSKFA
jgi:hypothetical protein